MLILALTKNIWQIVAVILILPVMIWTFWPQKRCLRCNGTDFVPAEKRDGPDPVYLDICANCGVIRRTLDERLPHK